MEIPRFDSIDTSAGASIPTPSNENDMAVREVVTAVHEVNKSELMGEGRQLTFFRDPQTHRPVIQIIDQSTDEVIDQIPAGAATLERRPSAQEFNKLGPIDCLSAVA